MLRVGSLIAPTGLLMCCRATAGVARADAGNVSDAGCFSRQLGCACLRTEGRRVGAGGGRLWAG